MPHWSDKYIGEPYIPETHDCAAFCARVYAEVFGVVADLPHGHGKTPAEQTALIAAHMHQFLQRTDSPQDGDVMLCLVAGREFHLGLLCMINGERWMVHASNARNVNAVVRTRLSDLQLRGIRLEGFYKCLS